MLKKRLHKALPGKRGKTAVHKEIIPFTVHHISEDMLSFAAEKAIHRLYNEGLEAYVAGGAVCDLLLGIRLKDLDVAANVTPEEVRRIFRCSRTIDRRFQIVYVMAEPETIEVTTFRDGGEVVQNQHGHIMKDNDYGNMEEDAMRRDLICNVFYYDPIRRFIVDLHHGAADVQTKKLVMIDNLAECYQEDPVRILHAARLSGKLGFEVEGHTAAPILEYAGRLKQEPVSRLFNEILRLLLSGHARDCLQRLNKLGIGSGIHPLLTAMKSADKLENRIISLALKSTDERLHVDKSISTGFVLAAVLQPQLNRYWQRNISQGQRSSSVLTDAINKLRNDIEKDWGVPQRFAATMREIWQFQSQLDNTCSARPYCLLAQQRFRAAYDFLMPRAQVGEADEGLVQWWTAFQHADNDERVKLTASGWQRQKSGQGGGQSRRKCRRKSRRKKAKGNGGGG